MFKKISPLASFALFAALGLFAFAPVQVNAQEAKEDVAVTTEKVDADMAPDENASAAKEEVSQEADAETGAVAEQAVEADVDVRPENGNAIPSLKHVTAIRTLGAEDAPVVMEDYSSLSCPHCATFHNEILPQLKRDFVDTGKLKIQFFPMPLNEAALMGEKVLRCLPLNEYSRAQDILYKTQSSWAFASNVEEALIEKARMIGLPDATARACINNKEFDAAIIGVARERAIKHGIASTPTFVFNDGEQVLRGVGLYDRYQLLIEGMVEKANTPAE